MVRHSHHHLPAHIGGVKYVPPCCGCGGINRQNLRREIGREKAKRDAGLDQFINLKQADKKEPVPQHVREMAGIKIRQHLAKDTVTFSQILQQKGLSKEKALEKLLDKLVAMYNSEKELMKALKKMDINKLMEILLKALKTTKEAELTEDEILNKKVNETKKKFKIASKHKSIQNEEEKENNEENKSEQDDENAKTSQEEEALEINDDTDSFIKDDEVVLNENTEKIENRIAIKSVKLKKFANPIKVNTGELKSLGIKYSSSARSMLKMQNDIEEDAIRKQLLQKNNSENPITNKSNSIDENKEKKEKLVELQDENERLKKIILDLQKERRSELLSGMNKE